MNTINESSFDKPMVPEITPEVRQGITDVLNGFIQNPEFDDYDLNVNGGNFYIVGDTLSFDAANIGVGSGSGFSIPVTQINNSTGTSWLGDNFDSVLLYGSLVEAYTYMKGEPDMMQLYNGKFMEALALAKRLGDGMERQDAYRSGQFRQRVTWYVNYPDPNHKL